MFKRYGSISSLRWKFFLKLICILGFLSVCALTSFYYLMAPEPFKVLFYKHFLQGKFLNPLIKILESNPVDAASSLLPTYELSIPQEIFDKMSNDPRGVGRRWANALLTAGNQRNLPVQIKFRGNIRSHWAGIKQSLRIKSKAGILFNGWKRTSLINMKLRDYIIDPFSYDTSRKIGLLAPNHRFVNLMINGKSIGLFHEVEDFDRYYLRKIERMQGDIFYLDLYKNLGSGFKSSAPWTKRSFAEDASFDNKAHLDELISCLKQRCSDLSQLIDIEQFLKNIIIFELVGSGHLDSHHNHRLYYDPSIGKFEPINWDMGTPVASRPRNQSYNPIARMILLIIVSKN